jgi:hypothetical protein
MARYYLGGGLDVTNGEMASGNTLRRVVVSFTNTSSHLCALTGFPGADLVTAAGGVLVSVERRHALAVHRVTLDPGEVASADVEAYAIDTPLPVTRAHAYARWSSPRPTTSCRAR